MKLCTRGCVAAAAVVALLGGCGNPFGSDSSTGSRYTPVIDDLAVSQRSVFCDEEFVIGFAYSDRQGDIERVRVLITADQSDWVIDDEIPWEDGDRLDLVSVPGEARLSYRFFCDDDPPKGAYTVRVTVIDEKKHVSNELVDDITLL